MRAVRGGRGRSRQAPWPRSRRYDIDVAFGRLKRQFPVVDRAILRSVKARFLEGNEALLGAHRPRALAAAPHFPAR